jgi:hypothetical protein
MKVDHKSITTWVLANPTKSIFIIHSDDPAETLVEIDSVRSVDVTSSDIDSIEAASAASQYIRDRVAAYPSLADQADMQYHDLVNSTTTWKDAIAAVKAAHPKP